jgi:CDP-4-dehydro-6-deoxyglucose reductase
LLLHARVNDHVQIERPFGNFLLREESPHAVVMVSEDTAFAPLKALIEHYINLEKPQPIHLYRMAHQEDGLYLSKLCDSWRDALDNFTYTPIIVPPGATQIAALKRIADEITDPAATDLYLAFHEETSTAALQLFTQRGVPQQQISLHHSRMLQMKGLPEVASH